MFSTPQVVEIQERARSMGVELDDHEAELFRAHVIAQLELIDDFVQARIPEDRPPLLFPERAPGYRPLAEEDPYNAWLWKCDIGGLDSGLLAGKSVSFKDHISVAGIPLTFGSQLLDDFIPDFDATVATRILEAGGRIIGKNTLRGPFGGRVMADGATIGDYWRPRNPHSDAHSTGGSSSGSAVAVALGDVDIAIGGDQRGSIRIPSAFCGVIGLKPTFGLVSHSGVTFGTDQSVDHVGPIAKNVEDVASALQAIAGFDGLDPRQGRLVPERIDVLSTLANGVDGLRIGILTEGFSDPIDEGVRSEVLAAIGMLEKAGATVIEISVPEHLTVDAPLVHGLQPEGALAIHDTGPFGMWSKTYYPTSIIGAWSRIWADQPGQIHPKALLDLMIAQFSRENFHGAAYAKAQNVRPRYIRVYDSALERVDVLAMPTCRETAPKLKSPPEDRMAAIRENLGRVSSTGNVSFNTSPFDYTGHPALAVPCGFSEGLPVSLQLVGKYFGEAELLRAAYAFGDSTA